MQRAKSLMPVYVDAPRHRYGRMLMCHMIADTANELHWIAQEIGLSPAWYQVAGGPYPASFPHYDISKGRRAAAIKLGAIEVLDRREYVGIMRRIRSSILKDPAPWRWDASCRLNPVQSASQELSLLRCARSGGNSADRS